MKSAKTLYDKIWDSHVVKTEEDGTSLLYIDRCLIHEVSSPQAFEGLRQTNREIWRKDTILAVADHQVPTTNRDQGKAAIDSEALIQLEALDDNCHQYGIEEFDINDPRQGIVHVVGPEQGITLPGTTLVCGDSHTSTHGALAALAQGIGTSELEHVFATQCLVQKKSKSMLIEVSGELGPGVTAKDLALYVIHQIGSAAGTGHVIEYGGDTVRALDIEQRLTLCNMAIEAGARAGLVAFDEKTRDYLSGRPYAPKGEQWDKALAYWQTLHSDEGAYFDTVYRFNAADVTPYVTWGTKPDQATSIDGVVPDPSTASSDTLTEDWRQGQLYMDVEPGTAMTDITVNKIFIGSCTNSRISDLREAAKILQGKKIASNIEQALVVPGSGLVKAQAEQEGLDKIFIDAGFEWRDAGCSMCNAMNADRLLPGDRCASTNNRNFEGRQGYKGRTHLLSPAMAAAAAVAGRFVDVRNLN